VRIVSTGAGGRGCHACRHPDRARDLPGAISRCRRLRRTQPRGAISCGAA